MNKQVTLSLEVAKQMYSSNNDALKAFALENYTKDELTKKELPKSFEKLDGVKGWYIKSNGEITATTVLNIGANIANGVYPTLALCKASIALAKLLHLRDVYRQGWIPNWSTDNQYWNWCIIINHNIIIRDKYLCMNKLLSFQSETIRDQFLNNFRSLIEEAKELL